MGELVTMVLDRLAMCALFRRFIGGRWTVGPRGVWCRVPECPAALNSFLAWGQPMPSGMCFDNSVIGMGRERACFCEVHRG